jgi:hypothetical protein
VEAACTSGSLQLTLTASEAIETPSGWSKTNNTTYTKNVTSNNKVTVNITDTAGNGGSCEITPTHYDVNGPTYTLENVSVAECST